MSYKDRLFSAVDRFCEATGKARSYVANAAVNDGKFFDRLKSGGGCTMDTYEKVMAWLEQNTPETPSPRK